MITKNMDLWKVKDGYRCITTNGFVKRNGACVMGRGCAREAAEKYPRLPFELGYKIQTKGNNVYLFFEYDILITFPTKHNWWEKADINLITQSCYQLVDLSEYLDKKFEYIYLPKPGCGNGELNWMIEVDPVITPILMKSQIPVIILDYYFGKEE